MSSAVKTDASALSPQRSSGDPFLYSHTCFMALYFTEATRVSTFSLWLDTICLFASPKLCSLNIPSFMKPFLAGKVDAREHELHLPTKILSFCFIYVSPKHTICILHPLQDCAPVKATVLKLNATLVVKEHLSAAYRLRMASLGNKNVKISMMYHSVRFN